MEESRINDYNSYTVDRNGNVYSYKPSGKKKLKPLILTNGYLGIWLSRNGIRKRFLIHRLVAEAFLVKKLGKNCVNHKDGNKRNNNIDNLEWCSHSENNLHSYEAGLKTKGEDHYNASVTNTEADKLRGLWNSGKFTKTQLSNMFFISNRTVRRIINKQGRWRE